MNECKVAWPQQLSVWVQKVTEETCHYCVEKNGLKSCVCKVVTSDRGYVSLISEATWPQ